MKGQKWKFLVRMGALLLVLSLYSYGTYQIEQSADSNNYEQKTATYISNKKITRAIPGGVIAGVYAKTDGVLVLEDAKILCDDGTYRNPAQDLLKQGDYIVSCNGTKVKSKEELINLVEQSDGQALNLTIRRNGKKKRVVITPVLQNGNYKIGVWVRDDIAGLGTITFVTEDSQYGALGHCISDMDLGIEIEMNYGSMHNCKLTDIRKGTSKQVGAIIGYIDYDPQNPIASVEENSEHGIFGCLYECPKELKDEDYLPIASKDEIKKGKAYIISDVSGKRKEYEIEIIHINHFSSGKTKNMIFQVTDEKLLETTGGIVQGMSGSPMIQNGKLIGAVTHVFVNESDKGYGIFIEEMLGQQ